MGLPDRPAANAGIQDLNRFIENLQLAAPYFATLTPGDYEANRELVRHMWTYLATFDLMARDQEMRLAVGRARSLMGMLRFGMAISPPVPAASGQPSAAPPRPSAPPFAKLPPDQSVPESEKSTAEELRSRYESAVARAASAWQSAESLRLSLAARGLTLNSQTAASVARLELDFEMAVKGMREHDWADVRTALERAEYETGKVFKAVGQ